MEWKCITSLFAMAFFFCFPSFCFSSFFCFASFCFSFFFDGSFGNRFALMMPFLALITLNLCSNKSWRNCSSRKSKSRSELSLSAYKSWKLWNWLKFSFLKIAKCAKFVKKKNLIFCKIHLIKKFVILLNLRSCWIYNCSIVIYFILM